MRGRPLAIFLGLMGKKLNHAYNVLLVDFDGQLTTCAANENGNQGGKRDLPARKAFYKTQDGELDAT